MTFLSHHTQLNDMFPIRDHNPSGKTPYVTWALIALNILVFFSYAGMFENERAIGQFFSDYALTPAVSLPHTYVTSLFLHAGFMHIAGNMLFLFIFGDNMEDEMGHGRFLLFYLVCGIGASAAHVMAAPNSDIPLVGASGAIAGVMGGYLLMFPKARVDVLLILVIFFKVIPVPAWIMLAFWFGLQLFNGLGTAADAAGVAYWAHAGGFVLGLILTIPVWMRRGGTAFWQRTDGLPPHPEHRYRYVRSTVPEVRRKR